MLKRLPPGVTRFGPAALIMLVIFAFSSTPSTSASSAALVDA